MTPVFQSGNSAAVRSRPEEERTWNHQGTHDSRFNCNICLEPVSEPVVTRCGHLYCWPCLFQWLEPGISTAELQFLHPVEVSRRRGEPDATRSACPVCKSVCTLSTIVPIYVRSRDEPRPNAATADVRFIRRSSDSDQNAAASTEHGGGGRKDGAQQQQQRTETSLAANNFDRADRGRTILLEEPGEQLLGADTTPSGLRHRRPAHTQDFGETNGSLLGETSPASAPQSVRSIPPRPTPHSFSSQQQPSSRHDMLPLQQPQPQQHLSLHQSLFQALLGLQQQSSQQQHHGDGTSLQHRIPPIHRRSNTHGNHAILPENVTHGDNATFAGNMDTTTTGSNLNSPVVTHAINRSTDHTEEGEVQSTYIPTVFSVFHENGNFIRRPSSGPIVGGGVNNTSIVEDAATEFLSRLLLMLGSFVILCLLLF